MKKIILFGLLLSSFLAFLSCAHSFKDSVEMMSMDPSERKAYGSLSDEEKDKYLQMNQKQRDEFRACHDPEIIALQKEQDFAKRKLEIAKEELDKAKFDLKTKVGDIDVSDTRKIHLRMCEDRFDKWQREFDRLERKIERLENENLESYAKARAAWKEKNEKTATMDTGSCFTPDTLVFMETGFKRIADIKAGDRVQTVDENGVRSVNKVVEHYIFTNKHYYLINGGIKVTARHRFYTPTGWVRAGDLKIGDQIQTSDGLFEEIISKEMFFADLTVYNLNIADNHNFFVSSDGKKGYLVHNTAGGGK